MVYDKEYYEKNKEKFKLWAANYKKENRKRVNEVKKKWRHGVGKKRNQISKKKTDKKYYEKVKETPEFKLKKKLYSKEYNSRPKTKELTAKRLKKYYAKPEVKIHRAAYNKKLHQDNPDKVLENTKRHLNKIGAYHNLNWYQMSDQLRGWSEIIHKDCDEICQVCWQPSAEAHHIFHKSKYPQLAFNRNNGIALCLKCHNESHGKMLINNTV